MDPEAIVYILIFLVVAVVQGIGQKKRHPGTGGTGVPGGGKPSSRPAGYPSDESGATEVAVPPRPGQVKREAASSEGLIPKEVWDEILGLARGTPPTPAPPRPAAEEAPPRVLSRGEGETLEVIPEFEARSLESLDPRPAQASKLPKFSKPPLRPVPSGPAKVTPVLSQVAAPLLATRGAGGDVGTGQRARELLGDRSPEELRKAIILSEVLGPPMALRE